MHSSLIITNSKLELSICLNPHKITHQLSAPYNDMQIQLALKGYVPKPIENGKNRSGEHLKL